MSQLCSWPEHMAQEIVELLPLTWALVHVQWSPSKLDMYG